MDGRTQVATERSDRVSRHRVGWSVSQWVVLIAMGGLILAVGTALAFLLHVEGTGLAKARTVAVANSGTATYEAPRDAIATPEGLYWPLAPLPLATPNAPGGTRWWDARFAYRQRVLLDEVASRAPVGTWARAIVDGARAQREGKMRMDAADVRVVVWDGQNWWEIPRYVRSGTGTTGWELGFQLQGSRPRPPDEASGYVYYVYYGHPFAGSPPMVEGFPEPRSLLLALDKPEAVEWGPEVVWRAGAEVVQTLVSPDGRVVFEVQPSALRVDTRVRLRTVPLSERGGHGPLPHFELHADPPPGSPGPDNVARWGPPLSVTIHWTGLEVDPEYLQTWAHFAYDTERGVWYSVAVEFDPDQGVTRFTTDQP